MSPAQLLKAIDRLQAQLTALHAHLIAQPKLGTPRPLPPYRRARYDRHRDKVLAAFRAPSYAAAAHRASSLSRATFHRHLAKLRKEGIIISAPDHPDLLVSSSGLPPLSL